MKIKSLVLGMFMICAGFIVICNSSHEARALTFFDDPFEPVVLPWGTSGYWHPVDEGIDPCIGTLGHPSSSHSSPNSYAYHIDASCDYDDGVTNSGNLTSPSIDLSMTLVAWLHFWTWFENEGGVDYDILTVQISPDGSSWNDLLKIDDVNYSMMSWFQIDIDISAYTGDPDVWIRFAFDTVDGIDNNYAGWYIDDVLVDDVAPTTEILTVTWTDLAPATVQQWEVSVEMLGLTLESTGSTGITDIRISLLGTGVDADIGMVAIYDDTNDNSVFNPGTDILLGRTVFFGGVAWIGFPSPFPVTSATPENLLILYNIAPFAAVGNTVGAGILAPADISLDDLDTVVLPTPAASGTPSIIDGDIPRINSQWQTNPPTPDGTYSAGEHIVAIGENAVNLHTIAGNPLSTWLIVENDDTYLYVTYDAIGDTTNDAADRSSFSLDTDNNDTETIGADDQFTNEPGHYLWDGASWTSEDACDPSFDSNHTGLVCATGFGPSDNSVRNHRIYEFRIPLVLIEAIPIPATPIGFVGASDSTAGVLDDTGTLMFDTWPQVYPSAILPPLSEFGDLLLATSPPPFGDIVGDVVDTNDDPIEDATVELYDPGGTKIGTYTTDATGEFEFIDVDVDTDYYLEVSANGYEDKTKDNVNVTIGSETDVGEIVLETNATISGKVVDEDDNPIEGATVKLYDADGKLVDNIKTDSNGEFEFTGLDYGKYSLQVNAPGFDSHTTDEFTIDNNNLDKTVPDVVLASTGPGPGGIEDWLWILLIIVIVVIAVLVIALLLARRRRKPVAMPPPYPGAEPYAPPGARVGAPPSEPYIPPGAPPPPPPPPP